MDGNKEIALQDLIYEIRGQRVMLDSDLAVLLWSGGKNPQ